MAGRIKAEDVAAVKERVPLDEIVGEHVTLRPAGPGSLKGLCPFHDEKTPSFYVRPAMGVFKCFGCDKGGDAIEFVMDVEHLTFTEAVERLAAKAGVELHYEDGPGPSRESVGLRTRLLEAHRVAAEFYADQLVDLPEARTGRDFLRAREFYRPEAERFGVGFAPRAGEALVRVLRDKGFTPDEMVTAGLVGRGRRGLYDRFRGRLVWPIRDITGDTIGFGARRIFDDDRIEAKYLNTAETPLYKKTQVLYGLDLAKKSIAAERKAVVVEGYTDVMAAHLAGVPQAVATCGTSFGADHVKALRRLIRDEAGQAPGRVIFTFDGDAAGQKAALRAFELDQQWAANSYVAVADGGQDPCELRLSGGPEAVVSLVDSAVPMFQFVARTVLSRFDLSAPEGRVAGMRAVAPVVKSIKDSALRDAYTREVAGWIGIPEDQLAAEVARAHAQLPDQRRATTREPAPPAATQAPGIRLPDPRDPRTQAERQLLRCVLQYPAAVPGQELLALSPADFRSRVHAEIFEAVSGAGDPAGHSLRAWVDIIRTATPDPLREYFDGLAAGELPTRLESSTGMPDPRYAASLIAAVRTDSLRRQISDAMAQLRQHSDDPDQTRVVSHQLVTLQNELARINAAEGA